MSSLTKTALVAVALLASSVGATGSPIVTTAGSSVLLEAPHHYSAGRPIPVSGRLLVGVGLTVIVEVSAGVPDQPVDILVNDVVVRTVMSGDDGWFSVEDLVFDASPPTVRTMRAVAARATPLETSSRSVTMSLDRKIVHIALHPNDVSLAPGATASLSALGTDNDGRASDVTADATWSSSDTSVATVSAQGVVTAHAPGTATVTASIADVSAPATVTVS